MTFAFTISSNLLFKHIANRLSAWHAPSNRANMLIDFCQGLCAWPPLSHPQSIHIRCHTHSTFCVWMGEMPKQIQMRKRGRIWALVLAFAFIWRRGSTTSWHPFYTYLYWLYRWAECLTGSIWVCFQFDKGDLVGERGDIRSREQSSHKVSCEMSAKDCGLTFAGGPSL